MAIMQALSFFDEKSYIIKYYGKHFSIVKLRELPSSAELGKGLQLIFESYVRAVMFGFNVRISSSLIRSTVTLLSETYCSR